MKTCVCSGSTDLGFQPYSLPYPFPQCGTPCTILVCTLIFKEIMSSSPSHTPRMPTHSKQQPILAATPPPELWLTFAHVTISLLLPHGPHTHILVSALMGTVVSVHNNYPRSSKGLDLSVLFTITL
jgi:hypothetical protein